MARKISHSMRSGDYICPKCRSMQFSENMYCSQCGTHKPTMNTMGEACFGFYPLAEQRMKCQGERHCPECHGIIHSSHSECLACRHRREAPPPELEGLAPGQRGGPRVPSLGAPDAVLALPGLPEQKLDKISQELKNMSTADILQSIEDLQDGGKKKEEELKRQREEEEEREREREEAEERERQKIVLEEAKVEAARVAAERTRRKDFAADRIAAMLEEDEQEAAASAGAEALALDPAPAPVEGSGADALQRAAEKEEVKRAAEEERRKRRAEQRKRFEDEEQEKRKKQRERRLQQRNKPAVEPVVLDLGD